MSRLPAIARRRGAAARPAPPGSQTFTYTGGVQTFKVPKGHEVVTVECWGASSGAPRGSDDAFYKILGGYVKVDIPVTPGETLRVYVGGQGANTPSGSTKGAGGWNGGGTGGTGAPGGGGASDVRRGTSLSDRLAVAAGGGSRGGAATDNYKGGGAGGGGWYGGGGGAAGLTNSLSEDGSAGSFGQGGEGGDSGEAGGSTGGLGGQGGADVGEDGTDPNFEKTNGRGRGGTQTAGGIGGSTVAGGRPAGGGGGSNYVDAAGNANKVTQRGGGFVGHGQVKITWPPV